MQINTAIVLRDVVWAKVRKITWILVLPGYREFSIWTFVTWTRWSQGQMGKLVLAVGFIHDTPVAASLQTHWVGRASPLHQAAARRLYCRRSSAKRHLFGLCRPECTHRFPSHFQGNQSHRSVLSAQKEHGCFKRFQRRNSGVAVYEEEL